MNNINDFTSSFFGISHSVRMIEPHNHLRAQLSYTVEGVFYAQLGQNLFIVPPNMAIFMPAGIEHSTEMVKSLKVYSVYFEKSYFKDLPQAPQLIHISELAKQIINKLCNFKTSPTNKKLLKSLYTVLLDEINFSSHANYMLKIPTEPKLLKVYELFKKSQEDFPSLEEAANLACVDIRTLRRLFKKNMDISFITWKQKFLFMRALELLQQYKQTALVAYRLGYNSESAFITMFKKMSGGKTPSHFKNNFVDKSII